MQREVVRSRLDRNTKMDILIRAAHAGEVTDDEMARKLQRLRRLRNRVHIRTVEELEYASYTAGIANASINILEEFRTVARRWIVTQGPTIADTLSQRVAPTESSYLPDNDIDFGPPVVTGPPDPEIPDFGPPDDDITW